MREPELIDRIRKLAAQTPSSRQLLQSIGDDCAVLRPRARQDLVFTTDFTIEGRHFTCATHSAADIGHKALARSLSDLAAMGARPLFCLVSLAVTSQTTRAWIDGFYRGLLSLAARFHIALAGGDLARGPTLLADVICCGHVPRGKALLRGGAHPGDLLYVSGELGGSASGLATRRGASWKRHKRPEPRLNIGSRLLGLATAAMDLSDGLSLDLARLCRESNVGAHLRNEIPIAPGATIEQALNGGEDYELLFTVPRRKRCPAAVDGISLTPIGEITAEPGLITFHNQPLPPAGFDHFRP